MEENTLPIKLGHFAVKKIYALYKEKTQDELLERLADAQLDINSPELQTDDFIRCFLATSEAMNKCTSKTKLFALMGMFVKGIETKKLFEDTDQYQDVLSIVSDLSLREIKVLHCMYDFDLKENNKNKNEKPEKKAERQLSYIANKFDTEIEFVKAWVIRLKRTGLLLSDSELRTNEDSIYFSHGFELHHLSPMAKDLKKWILFALESEHM